MQKQYNDQMNDFVQTFKTEIKEKFKKNDEITFNNFIDSYDSFKIKSNVSKNISSSSENRCIAKRSNYEQCTRKHNSQSQFCGTHFKSHPFGYIGLNVPEKNTTISVTVFTQEIRGIVFYIDNNQNVYNTEDIFNNVLNPKIIGVLLFKDEKYTIPEINLL